MAEIADEERENKGRGDGRWHKEKKEEQQHLNDYISEGERIRHYNPEATCNFSRQ